MYAVDDTAFLLQLLVTEASEGLLVDSAIQHRIRVDCVLWADSL